MAAGEFKETNMQGKRCLITGATSGIGLETAKALAKQGADLVLVSRSLDRCKRVAEELGAGVPATMTYHAADLADPRSIDNLVSEVRTRYDRLDVLVNNAGAMYLKKCLSPDGNELTWALNHLGYFRLTCGLLPLLQAAPAARIVNVASDAHRGARRGLNWDDLQYERARYRPFFAYCQSKLANILFTKELSRKLLGSSITANCLHPGFVASNFFAWPGIPGAATRMTASLFAISPERGAQTSIFLASSPDAAGHSGEYFYRCQPIQPARQATDLAAAGRLWELTAQMTGVNI